MVSRLIEADDAKTQFSELLDLVARGEEFAITRDGALVAQLIPARKTSTIASRAEAVRLMQALANRNRLAGETVRDLIAEGRS